MAEPGAAVPAGPAALAAIDCGTNSTRLLVAGPDDATVERRMVITRLGQGVDRERRLAEDAIGRTLDVLAGFREVMDAHGVGRARAVATSAVRDAANGPEFLERAGAVLGVRPELLSGSEEGSLSFRGATSGLDPATGPFLVVDVGGGSTELVVGGGDHPEPAAASLDVGCVRVSERFLHSDPPASAELEAGRRAVRDLLRSEAPRLGAGGGRHRMIGLAGTVSTAAVLDAGAAAYDRDVVHHRVLGRDRISGILERLAGMDHAGRLRVAGLEEARADVIVGGLLVLVTVMEHFGCREMLASETDILDGIVLGLSST